MSTPETVLPPGPVTPLSNPSPCLTTNQAPMDPSSPVKSPWRSGPVWGQASVSPPVTSLAEVMSEELAVQLNRENEIERPITIATTPTNLTDADMAAILSAAALTQAAPSTETVNDLMLAQLMQLEFDREHDKLLTAEQVKYNHGSKVSVSYDNYRAVHPALREDLDDSSDDEPDEMWHIYCKAKQTVTPKKGFTGKGKDITTKHDAVVCGKRNVTRMEEFPPGFASGDGSGMDLKLNNKVYNKLKQHSHQEEKRHQRLHEKKENSTAEQAVDPRTRLILYKLVNSGLLDVVNGCISTGKEACVYHADGGRQDNELVPAECAIKVFKTTLTEFKTREKYIKDDYRFRDRFSKQNPRKIIKLWAEKEMHNLMRMQEAGIRVPSVVLLRKHVLVMSFIGRDHQPAPKLKDVSLGGDKLQLAYNQCVDMMERLFKKCHLIHSDLSEYNMLWHDDQIWFIDVSQSVEPTHPNGLTFLYRDCTNVYNYFRKCGLRDVLEPPLLFNRVTGMDIKDSEDNDVMQQIREYENNEELLAHAMSRKDYRFDYFFEKTTKEHEEQKTKEQKKSPSPCEPDV